MLDAVQTVAHGGTDCRELLEERFVDPKLVPLEGPHDDVVDVVASQQLATRLAARVNRLDVGLAGGRIDPCDQRRRRDFAPSLDVMRRLGCVDTAVITNRFPRIS